MILFHELTVMAPTARREEANQALEARGFGPDNLSVPVGPTVGPLVTFWAGNPRVTPASERRLRSALAGIPGLIILPIGLRAHMSSNGLREKR
jgi:hypothetical protein